MPAPQVHPALAIMRAHRTALKTQLDGIVSSAERLQRDLTPAEASTFQEIRKQVIAQDELIADHMYAEQRSAKVDAVRASYGPRATEYGDGRSQVGGWQHTGGGETYAKENRDVSWTRDMFAVALGRDGTGEATERLRRNNTEARALSTTDGAAGDFVPPTWLISEYIAVARQARPTADVVRKEVLPAGTDTLNVPRILTGTAVAQQATQNTTVQNTDATTSSVTATVVTIAGGQTLSQQVIDQSPISTDQVLLQDLLMDLAVKVNLFVLNNNATNAVGLLNIAGVNAQTYTDASPTTAKLYAQIAQAAQQVQVNRFLPPDTIIMAPRRWAAFLSAVDSTGRPLVSPQPNGPFNTMGAADTGAEGPVGQLLGMRVVVDPSMPVNLGAGTNQDPLVILRASDQVLWESTVRAEAFRELKADSLGVYLRVFNYVAFTTRYPKSISVINGTGTISPVYGA